MIDIDAIVSERLSVYRWFDDGKYQRVMNHEPAAAAMDKVLALTTEPASSKVMATDALDRAVFEWTRAEGVVFP
jgi:hypothetical protein